MKRVVSFLPVLFGFLFLAATSQASSAAEPQQKPGFVRLDRVTASRPNANGIEIRSNSAIMQITALRDDVVRVRVGPSGQLPEDASWAVLSTSRTATVNVTPESSASAVGFKTTKLHVAVHKDPFGLTVTDLAGHIIAEDLPARPIEFHGASFRMYMKSPEDEHYFGLGDKPGPLDRRNEAFVDWNTDAFGWQESTDPIYKSIPYFITFRKGVRCGHFPRQHLARQLRLQQGIPRRLLLRLRRRPARLYILYGPEPKTVVQTWAWLTGTTPLPPVVVARLPAIALQLLPRGRGAAHRQPGCAASTSPPTSSGSTSTISSRTAPSPSTRSAFPTSTR